LNRLDIRFDRWIFPDHHPLHAADLDFEDDLAVLMTEKDAVKCRHIAPEKAWYLEVEALIDKDLIDSLLLRLPRAQVAIPR